MSGAKTVYLQKPDGSVMTVHGPDMGQVERLCERSGYRKLDRDELRERVETTDATDADVHEGHA